MIIKYENIRMSKNKTVLDKHINIFSKRLLLRFLRDFLIDDLKKRRIAYDRFRSTCNQF
jgi:hypothetical protein